MKVSSNNNKKYKAIDFFCGGGGMTCGLRQVGIDVIAGVDIDKEAKATYEFNNKGTVFIEKDIRHVHSDYFERNFGMRKYDDELILVGCSPCQFYSIINTDKEHSLRTKNLLRNFARFIDYYRPGYVLVENVPGILTNKQSIWPTFYKKLKKLGYNKIIYGIIDMSHYGVPQSRRRFSLIATRLDNVEVQLPKADEKQALLSDFIGEAHGFRKISAGTKDNTEFNHTVAGFIIRKTKRSEKIKRSVPPRKTKRSFSRSPPIMQNASDFSGAFAVYSSLHFRHSSRTSHSHHHQAATSCDPSYSRICAHSRGSALCSSAAGLSVVP